MQQLIQAPSKHFFQTAPAANLMPLKTRVALIQVLQAQILQIRLVLKCQILICKKMNFAHKLEPINGATGTLNQQPQKWLYQIEDPKLMSTLPNAGSASGIQINIQGGPFQKTSNSRQTPSNSVHDDYTQNIVPQDLNSGFLSPQGTFFQTLSNNSSGQAIVVNAGGGQMRETIQMPKLVPHPPLDTQKRYASVQNRGYGQQKLINNRMMLLNAISRIDELSQSHGGGIIGPSLDTERSNEYASIIQHKKAGMSSRVSLVKKQQDPKVAAKVLYNINQTNRLDRLLNNIRSPIRLAGAAVGHSGGPPLSGQNNVSSLNGNISVTTTRSVLTGANNINSALPSSTASQVQQSYQ